MCCKNPLALVVLLVSIVSCVRAEEETDAAKFLALGDSEVAALAWHIRAQRQPAEREAKLKYWAPYRGMPEAERLKADRELLASLSKAELEKAQKNVEGLPNQRQTEQYRQVHEEVMSEFTPKERQQARVGFMVLKNQEREKFHSITGSMEKVEYQKEREKELSRTGNYGEFQKAEYERVKAALKAYAALSDAEKKVWADRMGAIGARDEL